MSGSISSISGGGGASSSVPDSEYEILCDDNGKFLRRYTRDAAGALTVVDTQLNGSTAYTPVGTVTVCAASNIELPTACYVADFDGTGYAAGDRLLSLTRFDISAQPSALDVTWYNATTGTLLGTVPTLADLRPCGLAVTASEFCYTALISSAEYTAGDTLRYTRFYDASDRNDLAFAGEIWWNVTTMTPVLTLPPAAHFTPCQALSSAYFVVTLCDDNGSFLRHFVRAPGGTLAIHDTGLDGVTAYTVAGNEKVCTGVTYTESLICAVGVTLIRRVDSLGNVSFVSSNGAPVADPVTYTIGPCATSQVVKPCNTCRS